MKLKIAERKQAKIRLGLQGPSGAGKSYGALLVAFGMCNDWSKIAVIDTEYSSANLYAHLGNYNVLQLEKPFSPERYIEAIRTCEKSGIEIIIIDSISHEWDGSGGILDIHGNMVGNSFTNWSKVTPRHNLFVNEILQSKCHIIATIRSKQDYVLSEKNGKKVPEKVGLKGVTREGMDYEFTTVLDIDIKHNATASKDRTGLFMDKPPITLSGKVGERIASWCSNSISKKLVLEKIITCESVEDLKELYLNYPDYQNELSDEFMSKRREIERKFINQKHLQNGAIIN